MDSTDVQVLLNDVERGAAVTHPNQRAHEVAAHSIEETRSLDLDSTQR